MNDSRPMIGVGVLVVRDGRVLLGERRGAHGAGTWAPPGGHLEFGETVDTCARREVREETGLEISNVREAPYTSDVFQAEHKHYITLFVTASAPTGEPEVREPLKCSRWSWHPWSELPRPLFAPLATLLARGFVPEGVS
jgi:8-oxo-dGTP diphosphatase